jgi:hypothetical protein
VPTTVRSDPFEFGTRLEAAVGRAEGDFRSHTHTVSPLRIESYYITNKNYYEYTVMLVRVPRSYSSGRVTGEPPAAVQPSTVSLWDDGEVPVGWRASRPQEAAETDRPLRVTTRAPGGLATETECSRGGPR